MLVDMQGKPKGTLKRNEHKSFQTDRVILVPGPEEEISIVRHVYQLFIKHGKSERQIAEYLNEREIKTDNLCPLSPRSRTCCLLRELGRQVLPTPSGPVRA